MVGLMIKLYSHTLPPLQKKFAFDYLKLEQGKFQVALSTKMAKDNNIKMETEQDYDRRSGQFSDQGKYTPFLSKKIDNIMKSEIPQIFEDSYMVSKQKPIEGKKSIIKQFTREEEKEQPKGITVLEKIGMQTPKPDPKFLSIQRRDHLLDDHNQEDIVFNEEDEDISAGKTAVHKWMTNLKKKNDERKNPTLEYPVISPPNMDGFPKKRGFGDMDLIDSYRTKRNPNDNTSSPGSGEKKQNDFKRITRASLMAGLSERVKNLGKNNIKEESKEKEEHRSEENIDLSNSHQDAEMELDDSVKSSYQEIKYEELERQDEEQERLDEEQERLAEEQDRQDEEQDFQEHEGENQYEELDDQDESQRQDSDI